MSESILSAASLKGLLTAFQNFFDKFAYLHRVDRPGVVGRDTCVPGLRLARRRKTDDKLSISQHRNVGIVGRKDKLSTLLLVPHPRNDTFSNKTIVQVVLRLIHDERSVG